LGDLLFAICQWCHTGGKVSLYDNEATKMPLTEDDKVWIANQLATVRAELLDRIEKTETTLLTEFHKWASPVELRQRSHSAAMQAFDAELEAGSDRVTKLERS
jgi:hypothetical protein